MIPLSLLILGRAWEAAFDAIYGDPAHFADLRTRNDQGAPESPRELQSPEIMILSTFMNRFLKEIVRGWETSREPQKAPGSPRDPKIMILSHKAGMSKMTYFTLAYIGGVYECMDELWGWA